MQLSKKINGLRQGEGIFAPLKPKGFFERRPHLKEFFPFLVTQEGAALPDAPRTAFRGTFKEKEQTTVSDKIAAKKCWVLIEGPAPGDAHFMGRWLLAAAEADKLLQEQYEQDPSFKLTISRFELVYAFAFSPSATKSIELLMKDLTSFSLSVSEEPWGEVFAVMAEIGFFSQTGDRYQMTVPKEVSHTKIKTALLRLAATEDDSQFLHPEHLVHCLDERDTREWQLRLERLPWMHRVEDRNMLLDGLQT